MIGSKYKTPLILNDKLPKCTYCGRPAVYRRRTSGEYFCSSCFVKAFIRRIRKTISENNLLTPTSRILLFFSPDIPYTSLAMIDSIIKLEREYPTKIYISLPSDYKWIDLIERYVGSHYCDLEEKIKVVSGKYADLFLSTNSLNDRYLLSRIISFSIADRIDVSSVLLPYSLESLAVLTLANVLSAKIADVARIRPVADVSGITIGYPLYDTPWDDIVFYSYLRDISEIPLAPNFYSRCSRIEKRALHIYRDLALISKELAYNILKNPNIFREALDFKDDLLECIKEEDSDKSSECGKYRLVASSIKVEILSPCQLKHS